MLKIGIIGSGFGVYGLLPAFNSTAGCIVTYFCGRKTKRLVSCCQKIGIKKVYTNWQGMLDKEKLDAVALAVPPGVQYKIAKVAINKGLHIFAEKPLAVTLPQATKLLDLANKNKIVNAIDFLFPEIEEWKKVKEFLDKKKFGKLKQIYLNWDFLSYDIKNIKSSWKTDKNKGGGALSFYFSHSLYYLEYYAGKILDFKSQLLYSKESINSGEVGINLLLKFENGIFGYSHLCCNVRGLNRHQLVFVCEKGTIVLGNENGITSNFVIKIYTDEGVKQVSIPKEEDRVDEDERVKVVKKLTTRFIDSIVHNKKIIPSFSEGVRVQELIERIRANNSEF